MPPILALILCSLFVLFLLRLDRKQYPEATFALWVPTLWMLINATKPLGIWFGTGGVSMEEGSPLDRNVLITLALMGMTILTKRGFSWFNAIKDNILVFLLLGFMLMSVLWSDMIFVSLKRWTRELIAIIMAFVVATEVQSIKALMSIFRRIIYILIPFSYTLIHYFPILGRQYGRWSGELMWVGVADQKNGLALLCLFTIIFLVWSFITRRQGQNNSIVCYQNYMDGFILIMAIWLFMGPDHTLAYSATSTVTLTIVLTLFLCFHFMNKQNKMINANALFIIIAAIIIFGSATPFYGGLAVGNVASIFSRDETLTGRTDIWAYLIPYATAYPLLGHGFGGFWTDVHRAATSSHAHNGYLDIILNIGFIGLILFSIYLLNCCRRAHKLLIHDFRQGSLWICILFMIIVHNIAESSATSFTGFFAATNLFMLLSTSDHTENMLQDKRYS